MQAVYFASMNEAADFLGNEISGNVVNKVSNDTDWSGGTLNECIDMLRSGNVGAMERYSKLSASLPDEIIPSGMQQDTYNDVSGACVDMGLYMQGAPECMLEFTQRESNRFVDVYIGTGFSGSTSSDMVLRKYMYIVKLVDLLENNGTRCSLHLGGLLNASYGYKGKAAMWVKIKSHNEQLDIPALLCVVSTMFTRVFHIAVNNHLIEKFSLSMESGGVCRNNENIRDIIAAGMPETALYIGSMYSAFDDNFKYYNDLRNFDQFARHYLKQIPE